MWHRSPRWVTHTRFWVQCGRTTAVAAWPEQHHVHGVVGEAGHQRPRRQHQHDGQQEVGALIGTGRRPRVTLATRDAPAVGVQLKRHTTLHWTRRGNSARLSKAWHTHTRIFRILISTQIHTHTKSGRTCLLPVYCQAKHKMKVC